MKKFLLSSLLALAAIGAGAQTTFTVGDLTYTVTDEDAKTVSVKQKDTSISGAITIPATVENESTTYTVTSIASYAFYNNSNVTGITIPNSVTAINNNAFYNCTGLTTSMTIPASVQTIGGEAFYYISAIENFTFEDGDTPLTFTGTIGGGLPAVNLYIGRNIEGTGTSHISYSYDGNATKTVTVGPKVTTLYADMFYTGSSIESFDFSQATSLTTIGSYCFYGCSNEKLTSIDLSKTKVTAVPDYTFYGCSNLTTAVLPATVQSIGYRAFYQCPKLSDFTIPAAVTTIGDEVFWYTDNIENFTIEDSDTPLSVGNLGDGISGKNFYLGRNITKANSNTNRICFTNLESLTIGPKVTELPNKLDNTKLTKVTVYWTTPITIDNNVFTYSSTYTNATLWVPGGTKDTYQAADYWKNFEKMEFSSFVVSASVTGHGTVAVGDITASNGETKTTLIDRETDAVFTVTAETGYELTAFTVNGTAQTLTDGKYTVSSLLDDQTAVAAFAPITYTLTYTLAGGTVATANPASYNIETETFTLVNPTRTGYDFAGWTGTDLSEPTKTVTIAKGSTGNRTYTATWTPTVYTITYTLDGGEATNPTTYTIETETFSLTAPTKTGYDFKGWKLNGTGEAQMTVTIAKGSTGNLAYTATWTPTAYTISYDLQGGSVEGTNPTSYTIETAAITLINPTKEHYDFAGWTGTGLDAATTTVTIAKGSTGNRSYTANWTEKTYTVTITGGGVTADNYSPKYGDDVVLTIQDDEDATLTSLTVNGTDVTASISGGKYTIQNVQGNVSVVATWNSTKEFITLAHAQQTFSCDQDLDFSGVSGLKVYIASGFDRTTGTVLLTRVESVPANTGLLIVGTEGATYKVPYATSTAFYSNLLKPVLTAQTVPATEGAYTNFLYGEKGDVQGFYKSSGSGEVSAKKAYLQLPTSAVSSVSGIGMKFDDDMTAIDAIGQSSLTIEGSVYDLRGQKVDESFRPEHLQKGIYVVGGRKVVVK